MSADLESITRVVTTALLRDLGDEVDLIFRYGSQLQGNTHAYSDLDLSYTPVDDSTSHSITVVVGQTMCDLYPIRWSTLESMAKFENVSSTVLLKYQIVYQRSQASADRLHGLADQLRALQQPDARPQMIRKAQEIFQRTAYPYFLLRQAAQRGHQLAALQNAQQIISAGLHSLAVFNQSTVDTRKMVQLLALPNLPVDFAQTMSRLTGAVTPAALLESCDRLLRTTRDLLLSDQQALKGNPVDFATAFGPGYPELKGDIQHILLGCERQDLFTIKGPLVSLYHELSRILSEVTGVEITGFDSLMEYEQDLAALGFPALLPYLEACDFAGLHAQCLAFDHHLQRFLTGHHVPLYAFATVEDLQRYLGVEIG
jgi:GAF domain-containing protein